MKKLLLALSISMTCLSAHAAEGYLTAQFGPASAEATPVLLKSYAETFCSEAPQMFSKAYGQVIFSKFDCLGGHAEVRIKDGKQTFTIQNVDTYYGDQKIILIADLTPKADGNSYFSNLRQLGLAGE